VDPRARLDLVEKTNTIADIIHTEQHPLYKNLRVAAISMHVSCSEVYYITRHYQTFAFVHVGSKRVLSWQWTLR
jgi:hypothetical protein